jgi:two-component system, cell cycle response regulator DivK
MLGCGTKVRFVGCKELKHGAQHGRIGQARTQGIGIQSGQRQQSLGARAIGQHPDQCAQRQGKGVGGGLGFAKNCRPPATRCRTSRMAKRILVVEDNDLNRKLFCDVLRSQGYAVEPCADGLEALDKARRFVPNLIIMDIQLPNVSGLDLIEAAKADAVLRQIPVLAVTAYAGKGDEERIRDAGAEGYLAKPVSIGPFMAAVKGLVEKAAA